MEYKFEHIATNSTAKKLPEESDREHYIGLEHLDTNCFTISRWGSDITPVGEKLLMKKGDVLFGKRRAYQRKVGIAPFDGIFSAHGMVLRPKEDVIDKDFFPFFINSDQFMERAIRISVGGLSPTINWKDLKEQVFELPSLEEQKVLASKLWAAYNLKESYKTLLAKTDEMVKSRFIAQFENSDYMRYSFDDICYDDTKSATKIPASEYLAQGSYPIYDQATDSIIAGYSNDSNGVNMVFPAVLFGDHSRVVKYIDRAFYIGADGVKILRPINADLSTEFLYYQLKFKDVPNTGYNRHFKYLKLFSYCCPNAEEQRAFLAICHQADKSKFSDFKSRFISQFGNLLPSHTIGEVAEVYDGTHQTPNYVNEGIRFVSVEDINDLYNSTKFISEADYQKYKHVPTVGDIIMTRIGSIGKCAIVDREEPLAYYVSVSLLKLNHEMIDSRYLKYYLESDFGDKELKLRSLLKAFPMKINLKEIPQVRLILPEIAEQIKFVDVVKQADKSKYLN